jgi:glycosyltransferase involved in cell wall biosynthesis
MEISLFTPTTHIKNAGGYNSAYLNIKKSLEDLGHEVLYSNSKTEVQVNFAQPNQFKMHRGQYQIGYTPWESTVVPSNWFPIADHVDEMWTTSEWNAQVFEDAGLKKPIHVYNHGISDVWKPRRRKPDGVIKFLHVGEPAPRKAGQMVVNAFTQLYGNNPSYSLTIKAYHNNTTRVYNNYIDKEIIGLPNYIYNNINIITEEFTESQLLQLYYDHDVLVYPSYGEGFGFIPLQALATGMPTICTSAWADYKKFIGPLSLKSKLTQSPFLNLPGLVFEPNYQHLLELMRDVVLDYNAYSGYYYAQSTKIHEEYNWLQLTENSFDHIFKKFS